jgi:hypothetical protein
VRRKISNLSSRQLLKIAKGLRENETRLCKCLKNVRLTAGDRKQTVSSKIVSHGVAKNETNVCRKAARRKDDAEGSHSLTCLSAW